MAKIRYTNSRSTPTNHAERPLLVINDAVMVAISIITMAPGQNCRFIGEDRRVDLAARAPGHEERDWDALPSACRRSGPAGFCGTRKPRHHFRGGAHHRHDDEAHEGRRHSE